jgi:Zn-dependent peptidase ImmA (M78 family)
LAHELCHLLYDRHHGVELQIVSGEWAPVEIEKRANAFAAALLMPDALIIRAAREENVDLAHLDYAGLIALAKKTDVSLDALGHHLVNRRWIDEAQRAELMASSVDLGGAKERKVPARKVRRETVPTQLVREKV